MMESSYLKVAAFLNKENGNSRSNHSLSADTAATNFKLVCSC